MISYLYKQDTRYLYTDVLKLLQIINVTNYKK